MPLYRRTTIYDSQNPSRSLQTLPLHYRIIPQCSQHIGHTRIGKPNRLPHTNNEAHLTPGRTSHSQPQLARMYINSSQRSPWRQKTASHLSQRQLTNSALFSENKAIDKWRKYREGSTVPTRCQRCRFQSHHSVMVEVHGIIYPSYQDLESPWLA